MEPTNRHPLESITGSSGLSMLELLIPFVDYPLKLPLALFIKFTEIRLIINAFHSLETVTRLGLHSTSNSPTDMLCSLTGISPEMLQMLLSLSGNTNASFSPELLSGLAGNSSMDFSNLAAMFQQMNTGSMGKQSPSPENTVHGTEKQPEEMTESGDFERNIQQILAEYDMQQAEQLHREDSLTQDIPEEHNIY